ELQLLDAVRGAQAIAVLEAPRSRTRPAPLSSRGAAAGRAGVGEQVAGAVVETERVVGVVERIAEVLRRGAAAAPFPLELVLFGGGVLPLEDGPGRIRRLAG